jgi:lichenan operon transcriptional antiterminator
MNKQELTVLNSLLLKTDWTTSSEIINTCGGSLRLLRNIVKEINSQKLIIDSSQKGYQITNESRDYVRDLIANHSTTDNEQNNQDYRVQFIINKFLTSKNRIDYFELAEDLFISESTLNTELVLLRKVLDKYELTLKKQKDFLYLSGEERNIRKLAKDTIYGEVRGGLLNQKILGQTFKNYNVHKIRSILSTLILQQNLYINDFGLLDLVLHLCIAMDRISNKQSYHDAESNLNFSFSKVHKVHTIAIDVTEEIFRLYSIKFNEKEIQEYSLLILLNVKEYEVNSLSFEALRKSIPEKTIQSVYSIISKVYDNYFVDLNNEDFVIRFSLHLDQLINTHKQVLNPLFSSIKHSYPLVFDISVFISDLITNEYSLKLDNHDISFIALHVGMSIESGYMYRIRCILLIPDYYNLKQLLLNNITTNFGNVLDILAIYSDETQIDLNQGFELMLSTSPLSSSYGVETLIISPFISEIDHNNILREIHIIQKKKYKTEKSDLVLLFKPQTFTIIENKLNQSEVLNILTENLRENGYVSANFLNEVQYREELSSTSFSNLAVPHSMQLDAKITTIAVALLKNKTQWGDNSVNVVLLLAITSEDRNEFKRLFQTVLEVFTSEQWNQIYRNISSFQQFIDFIIKYNN